MPGIATEINKLKNKRYDKRYATHTKAIGRLRQGYKLRRNKKGIELIAALLLRSFPEEDKQLPLPF